MNYEKARAVCERDFRCPEFRDANPEDYEFRSDGKIVRKDRWETGIRAIQSALGDPRKEFEIDDLVRAVRAMVAAIPPRDDQGVSDAEI